MSDPKTRDSIEELLKENCPLRSVLKPEKACPYTFIPAGQDPCPDCHFKWTLTAEQIRKMVSRRRASYETEREKVKMLKNRIRLLEEDAELIRDIGRGIKSTFLLVKRIIDMVMSDTSETDSEKEDKGRE